MEKRINVIYDLEDELHSISDDMASLIRNVISSWCVKATVTIRPDNVVGFDEPIIIPGFINTRRISKVSENMKIAVPNLIKSAGFGCLLPNSNDIHIYNFRHSDFSDDIVSIEKIVRANFAGSLITNVDLFDEEYYVGSTDYFHNIMSISAELPKNGESEYERLWSVANLIKDRIKWLKSNSEGESNNVNV